MTSSEYKTKPKTKNKMKIEITYNESGNHEASASATIDGVDYYCVCNGLSSCGEAFFSDNFSSALGDKEQEELRDAAYQRVKQEWDYDGSNWSEPVDEPDDKISEKADDEHQVAIVRTAFHGGGVRGYAVSEESANEWITHWNAGGDCKCGCYGVCPVSDIEDLPEAYETSDPYTIAL
jgi:hypothetical protein